MNVLVFGGNGFGGSSGDTRAVPGTPYLIND